MTDPIDFKKALKVTLDQKARDFQTHPEIEELAAYRLGKLPIADSERLSEHLAGCRECFDQLIDLGAFAAAAEATEDLPVVARSRTADFESAAFWRGLKPRIGQIAGSEEPAVSEADLGQTDAGRSRIGGWKQMLPAIAASAAVTALGFSTWMAAQQRQFEHTIAELRQPRIGPAIHDLYLDTSQRSGRAPKTVTMSTGSLVIVTPQDAGDFGDYGLEIVDEQGAQVWFGKGFEADPEDGTYTLWLPPGSIEHGEYRVRLLGLDGETSEVIEEYVALFSN